MAPRYTPDAGCFDAANAASGGKLARAEIEEAFQRVVDFKGRLQAAGDITGMEGKLRKFAEAEAERTRIAAALQKRHAALNILVRDRLDQTIQSFTAAGMTPRNALLAVMEGTQRGVEGGRNSVAALNLAYEARYMGAMMSELQAARPHLAEAMRDPRMDADILREMAELKEDGKPGITGNADAQYVAKVFASYAEMSRQDMNRLGASVGKLDGWAGAQTHDDVKMIAAGKDAWVAAVRPKLDLDRTFEGLDNAADVDAALGDVYDTIITGFPNRVTPREKGQRVNPANLAKSLGKSRVLHFKNADAALAYRDQFGYGNTVSGIFAHLRKAGQTAAAMETLGPNPEIMFGSIADTMRRNIKNSNLPDAVKQKQIADLDITAGPLRQALDIATGLVSRPVNATAAKIGADIRAVQSMAKLGGAVFSSFSDNITAAAASQFRGSGFLKGLTAQLGGLIKGRPKGEQAEISYLLGEGFDGLVGHIVSPAAANDGVVGKLAGLQEKFFRFNGLSWWTDVQRSTAGRTIAAEMGMRSKAAFDKLPANYRHVLGLHGITQKHWEAIRQAQLRESNGNTYVTPDRIRDLGDDAIEPVVQDRIAAAREALKVDEVKTPEAKAKREAAFAEKRTQIIADGRRDLEMAVLRFVADETNYGLIEIDARTRRTLSQGLRPGTVAGEAIRFIGQFKGFPVAFTQRVGGRALYGHSKDASFLDKSAHIGGLLAGLTMAGYASIVVKDILKGYWPPRDPMDPKTLAAAFIQGGAAGIYGDYLFGSVNRFGGGILETVAGPTIGEAASGIELGFKARDALIGKVTGEEAKAPWAEALSLTLGNTPFVNLFYIRPTLDFLFVNSLRDAISPGYMKRQEKRRTTDYGQKTLPYLGDRQALN
jgi:hypothetical protein